MKIRQILILITSISIFMSCDKKDDNIIPKVDSYPMTAGTEWTYDRQVIIKKYESETSDNIIEIDTVNFTVKVWIEKDTVLNDTMSVKIFKSQENDNSWTSNQFKYLDNEGLRNYAYSNSTGANVFAKKSSSIKNGLFKNFHKTLNNEIFTSDDIIFEDKPTLDIKLPLGDNSSWTFREPSETRTLQIDKSVIGNETLILFGETFACYKVTWEYLNDQVFDGVEITDWISNKGLIKRKTFYDRVTLTTQDGEPIGGNVQTTEILTLKALNIK